MDNAEQKSSQAQHGFDSFEKVAAFWQELVKTQLGQVESTIGRVDTMIKAQMTKTQTHLDEVSKLATSTLIWASELQAGAVKAALDALRSAGETVQKARG